jgi:hypothetical protein
MLFLFRNFESLASERPTESGIDAGQRSYGVFKVRRRWDDALLLNLIMPVGKKKSTVGNLRKTKAAGIPQPLCGFF